MIKLTQSEGLRLLFGSGCCWWHPRQRAVALVGVPANELWLFENNSVAFLTPFIQPLKNTARFYASSLIIIDPLYCRSRWRPRQRAIPGRCHC